MTRLAGLGVIQLGRASNILREAKFGAAKYTTYMIYLATLVLLPQITAAEEKYSEKYDSSRTSARCR